VELQRQLEQQLTLTEGGGSDKEERGSGPAGESPTGGMAAAEPAHANGGAGKQGKLPAAEEEVPAEFNDHNFWKASFDVQIDELEA